MLKLSKDHKIYEVYCDYADESVFIDHNPSEEEMEEIRRKNWPGTDSRGMDHKVQAIKLRHFYTKTEAQIIKEYRDTRGED